LAETLNLPTMKKNYRFLLLLMPLFCTLPLGAQYCMLSGQTPYSTLQPGITNFKLNTINRTSSNSESTASVVVLTGQSTTLVPGQTYTISISHSEDTQFFPGARNNLRVWADLNNNLSFLDAGETILTKDLEAPATTYTATFTLPGSTPGGTYTIRATAKMSADAGHSLPTPCNVPADPLGYHGEMEDYTIVVAGGDPGQAPVSSFQLASTVCIASAASVTNASTGTPTPTYSWSSSPSVGVTFSPNSTATNPKITFSSAGNFTITCLSTNSVSTNAAVKTVTVKACSGAGVSEAGWLQNISMGPIPVCDVLNIQLPYANDRTTFELVNCTGEIVSSGIVGKEHDPALQLDMSAFQNGIYIIRIKDGTNMLSRTLIINR
jgi:hypothetical protein